MDFYQMKQEVLLMDPKCIRFMQENIDFYFQRGAPTTKGVLDAGFGFKKGEETLRSLLEKMSSGAVKIEDIPRIRVIKYKDCWYSLDSKRLWVLRQLGQEIPVEVIPRPANALLRKIVRGLGDGETVQIRNPEKKGQSHEYLCKQELLNRVLIWSMKDLLTANPVIKVGTVPFRFSSVEDYRECFRRWLLEETRVQLQQNLLKISELPCVRLIIDQNITSFGKKTFLKRLSFTVDDSFMGHKRSRGTPSKLYNPKVSDVVLLSTVEPQHIRDLLQAEALCGLAVVQGGQSSSSGSVNVFEAIIYALSHGPFYKGLSDEHLTWYALKLESLVTCQRIWESLHRPQATALAEYIATYSQSQEVEPAMSKFQDGLEDLELSVKRYCKDIRRLNDSQTDAVRSFIMGLRNRESDCCVRLIQGPPGTGKTSTLTAMLLATSCLNTRILVCAPTNTAVNEAARRFLDQRQQDLAMAQSSHFCSDLDLSEMPMSTCDSDLIEMPESAHAKPNCETLRLGDIVMLGSEDRLDVEGSVLKHILLPLRVKRLLAALSPTSGWQVLCQTFMMKLMEVSSPYACEWTPGDHGQAVLESIGRKVIAHGETLCDDLPSPLLSSRRRNVVTKIVGTVHKLLALLSVEEFLCCEDDRPQFSPQPIRQDKIKSEEAEPGTDINDDLPQFSPPPPTHQEVIEIDDDDSPDVFPQPYEETGPENHPGTTGKCYKYEFLEAQQDLLESITSEAQYPVFPNSAASSFEWLEAQCMESASLVFSTVSSAGLRFMKLGLPFSCVIVDEAAQLVEAETAIITQMEEVKQLVLVGDHKQLPATVMSQLAQQHNYGRSLFERLQVLGHPCLLLDVQYRMHPAISCFSNNQFYNHKLKNGYNVLKEAYGNAPFQRDLFGPYAFIDVSDGIEENVGSSKKNPVEAELVLHLIDRVYHSVSAEFKDFGIDDKPLSIGVITPYGGQVGFIKDRICKHPYGNKNIDSDVQIIDVEIKTVDGFQGKEKDIIIFSSVRANQAGNIGFVDDERRLNVALTRGRYAVWILGSAHTLKIHSKVWRDLIVDAKRTNSFIDATGDGGMSKVIQKFRSEYRPKLEPDRQGQDYIEIESTRSSEALPTMMEVPRRNEWESIEQYEDDGPDWSCLSPVLRLHSEEADQYPEAGRKKMQVKRSKLSDREHQTSASFKSPTQQNLWHRRKENEDYGSPLKDRFATSYSRRDSAYSTGRHGWRLQPEDMNRSTTSKAECVSIGEPSSSEERGTREGYDQHPGSLLGVPPPDSGDTNVRHHRPDRLPFHTRPLRSHPRQTIRSREALPTMVDGSRWSVCKSLGQSGGDGPDWSCLSQSCLSPVRRSPKEEAYIYQKDEREGLLTRSNLSQRDYQTSSSFQSPSQQHGWHQAEGNEDYTSLLRGRFTSSYSRHERDFSSGRSTRGRQPVHMNSSSTLVADCGVCVSYGEPSSSEQRGIQEDDDHLSKQLPDSGNSNSRHHRPSSLPFDSWTLKSHPRHRIRSNELLPTMVGVPNWSEWESMEQSEDYSPDWSSLSPVLRSSKEAADQSPEAEWDGLMVKRSTFSERDFRTSDSNQSATQHNVCHRAQRNDDDSHCSRDRFEPCYSMPERALSSSRHGRRPQPGDMNRSSTSKADCGTYISSSEQRGTQEQFGEHPSSLRRVPYTRQHRSNGVLSDSSPTRFRGEYRQRFLRKNWRDYDD